jgi:hypothetical protein
MTRAEAIGGWLNHSRKRKNALETARIYYDLGHNLKLVNTLIEEARLHHRAVLYFKRYTK